MSRLVMMATIALLLSLISTGVFTEVSSDEQFLEDVSQAISDSESPSEVNYDDRDYSGRGLLDLLMTRPNKRQWCRKGMTYNHVLGSCTLSFSALRGKGRRY